MKNIPILPIHIVFEPLFIVRAFNSARPGGGIFSFGTTAVASASLFTTNSIDFVNVLPEELSTYSNDINLTIAGEIISVVSASL